MKYPPVSVVISTLNRDKYLKDTLLGLRGLRYPEMEVIVVNGPSTDGTADLLEEWAGKIKVATCGEPNLSMSRNIGIAAASGDVVAFVDDDAIPHPNWLKELVVPYLDRRVGAAGGFTIDNTGVRYQVRKTVCDRYGNAHSVSPFFDERALCARHAPYFPSLLGTNSSFRRDVLLEIGGFDHTFAYFLDETDVCLRVIDAGYEVHYAPRALVFHQFAPSDLRDARRIPKTLYPSVVSKSYFIMRHGVKLSLEAAAKELESYRRELHSSNAWLADHSEISEAHAASLNQDVAWGIERGMALATANSAKAGGDLEVKGESEFVRFCSNEKLRIAFVSQGYPPENDTGIARWTSMMASGLASRGYDVHVITKAHSERSIRFEDGIWMHRIHEEPEMGKALMANLDLPPNIASWAAGVRAEICSLKSFGLDVVSFPIWDVEGIAIADDPDFGVVMSLHTSYAMALPFKEDWQARPLYRHFMVEKMIKAEKALLEKVPTILANSRAIIDDLTKAYSVDISDRVVLSPHGTWDPFALAPERSQSRARRTAGFSVAFVGRFEPRKGFDIAASAIASLLASTPDAHATFVGDLMSDSTRQKFIEVGADLLLRDPRASFPGLVSRAALDDLYAEVDVVVMPSRYESFGLVAIEAMAAGASVVAVSAGGLAEVVSDGLTGHLVRLDGSEVDAISKHLRRLARDRRVRTAMGEAARSDFLKRFTVDAMVENAERAYKLAAERRAK